MADEEPVFETTAGPVRVITAASLFDGHDAAINVMRRLIQSSGAEVIHLGHDQSAKAVVDCAVQEDAHAVALTSYQGGHVEYFSYIRELLDEAGCEHVRILVAVEVPSRRLKSAPFTRLVSRRFTHPMMDEPWASWV